LVPWRQTDHLLGDSLTVSLVTHRPSAWIQTNCQVGTMETDWPSPSDSMYRWCKYSSECCRLL